MELLLTAVVILTCFSPIFTDKTFGDVRKCAADNLAHCKRFCGMFHADTKELATIEKCFEQKRSDFTSCMKDKGVFISDSTPCYPLKVNTKGPKNADTAQTQDVPMAVQCFKACINRGRPRCHSDCNGHPSGSDSERKKKLEDCKNDDQIQDCLESEANTKDSN